MPNCVDDRASSLRPISSLLHHAKFVRVALTVLLAAIGALPLVLATPPFQVPDEVQHFYRAYQLSDLRIRAEVQNGASGGTLPTSLPQLVRATVSTQDAIYYPATPQPISKSLKLSSLPLNSSTRQFVPFPGSAFYSPLPYIPQVLGLALGRLFGCGPLYLLYIARLFNCLAALAILTLAVYAMPIAAELLIIVGILPMSLFLYASVSPDAMVIACALLFTSLAFLAVNRGSWKPWEIIAAAAAAAVFCSVKPPYAPVLLAGLVPGLLQRNKASSVLRSHAILLAAALGVTAGWLLFTRSSMTSPLDGAHPSLQMAFVRHHPALFLAALAHTLRFGNLLGLYYSTVGIFGWLTVWMKPVFVFFLPLLNFVIVWSLGVRTASSRSLLRSLWYLALALASLFLIMTAMYLMDAQVGQNEIVGLQGRYLIPLLALAGMAVMELAPRRSSASPWPPLAWTASIIILQIIATDITTIRGFHVF